MKKKCFKSIKQNSIISLNKQNSIIVYSFNNFVMAVDRYLARNLTSTETGMYFCVKLLASKINTVRGLNVPQVSGMKR